MSGRQDVTFFGIASCPFQSSEHVNACSINAIANMRPGGSKNVDKFSYTGCIRTFITNLCTKCNQALNIIKLLK